jgi:hypothetical protein
MKTQLPAHFPDAARAAMAPLWKAFACAQDLKLDPWEFALPLLHLFDLGVDKRDLRWLVLHGYVAFRDRARRSRLSTNVAAGGDPRLMITETGVMAAGLRGEGASWPPGGSANSAEILPFCLRLPRWDRKRRVLLFDECVVKRFRLPAKNQEAVLSMFEDEGWPPSIPDPLPFVTGHWPKERLHATIRHLNASHEDRLIRFRGNGTGEAVLWEPIAASAVEPSAVTLELRRAA